MEKNKIDELFKKGLSDPKLDFNEEHWANIQSRLDQRIVKKKNRRVLFGLITSAAALATIFFIWNKDLLIMEQNNKNASSVVVTNKSTTEQKEIPTAKHIKPTEVQSDKIQASISNDLTASQPRKNDVKLQHQIAFIEVMTPSDSILKHASLISSLIPKTKELKPYTGHFNALKKPFGTQLIDPNQAVNVNTYAHRTVKNSRPTLTVLAGPDLTSVRGAGSSSLSENVGIVYSYPVINRLTLSLGATYAKKNYKSPYSFYSPKNPPVLTQIPSQVNAECDVIDIPLTASYTVLQSKKVKFNVSAGISSYFMLKEKYTFDYEKSGSYAKASSYSKSGNYENKGSSVYEISGENQHLFGVADFSISVEKKVSDKINVGIKPFVKMPLTGIGYGRVDLESKGIALTLGVSL